MRTSHSLRRLLLAIAALPLISAADVPAPASTPAQVTQIRIGNFTFVPATLTIVAGTQVTWINEDDVPHTVVGTEPGTPIKSPALDTDDRYAASFPRPGTYTYFCSLHPHMTGTIVVQESRSTAR